MTTATRRRRTLRRVGGLTAILLTGGAVGLVTTIDAHAGETTYRLQNAGTGLCLESFLQSDPQRPGYVYAEPCPPQGVQWRTLPVATPSAPTDPATAPPPPGVRLLDVETGWCLHAPESDPLGRTVDTRPCADDDARQVWFADGDTVRSAVTDTCVTGDTERAVFTAACAGDVTQRWTRG